MIRRVLVAYNADWLVTDVRANSDVVAMAVGVRSALEQRGFSAELLAVSGEDVCDVVQRVRSHRPDLVFNLCESLLRDARHEPVLPALLDLYGIAYTGSAPLALGTALRKSRTKELIRARGVPTPEAVAIAPGESADAALTLGFPVIVKPGREDASIGIEAGSVVRTPEALVERFIDGRELYVTVLDRAVDQLQRHRDLAGHEGVGRQHGRDGRTIARLHGADHSASGSDAERASAASAIDAISAG